MPADLKSLTAFRFFAAFWVFLFHLRTRVAFETPWFAEIVDNGARGVDFFFILSGFVIFHVYEPQIAAGRFSLRGFMVRRFARIYPLHLAMLVIFVVLTVIGNNPVDGVLASVTLLHAWGITDGLVLNGPSWTLSAEMFAYLMFGLLVFRRPSTWIIAAGCTISAISAHAFALRLGETAFLHLTWDYGIVRIIPTFLLGMLLRRLAPMVTPGMAAVFGVSGMISFFYIARIDAVWYEIFIPFVLLILAGARLSDRPKLPTNSKMLVYLGEISYSTYMIHVVVIMIWFDYLPGLGIEPFQWPLMISFFVIAGSAISYHLIEVPMRKRINRYAGRPGNLHANNETS